MADVEGVGAFSADNMTLLWLPQQHAVHHAYVCAHILRKLGNTWKFTEAGKKHVQ